MITSKPTTINHLSPAELQHSPISSNQVTSNNCISSSSRIIGATNALDDDNSSSSSSSCDQKPSKFYKKIFIFGTICLINGLLINYALPPVISMYIDSQIALTPNSQSYPMWKEIPVPVYQKFYFFNVTNAQDIEQRGHKPIVEEIGPFVYRSDWSKRDIEQDDLEGIINFRQFKQWQFVPEMSIADHRLQVVTLNAPLAITLTLIQSAPNAVRLLVTFSLDGLSEGFFTKRSIKQLLFEGYPDLLTTFGPLLNAEMLSQGGHFGYMNARNNSEDGNYQINTGASDIKKLNTINKYNGRTELPYWTKHYQGRNSHQSHLANKCNSLEGSTTGEMFPPAKDDNDTSPIKLFQPDFCRVWRLDYNNDFKDQATGLKLRRYYATRDVFRNSTDLPENACFFTHPRLFRQHSSASFSPLQQANEIPLARHQSNRLNNRLNNRLQQQQPATHHHHQQQQQQQHSNQNFQSNQANSANQRPHGNSRVRHEWPNGVFSLAPCKFNAPIYMSMPHFLDADPYFIGHVDGLEPEPDKHEFFVDLEPRTGSPVVLNARVQLNVAISKPPGLVRFRNVPEIMFPVFWQELSVNVSASKTVVDQLLLASSGALEVTRGIALSFLIIGGAIITTAGIFYVHFQIYQARQSQVGKKASNHDESFQAPRK